MDYPVKLDRSIDPLERLRFAILDHEQPRDQPMHGVGDNHGAWFRSRLHACSNIRSIAEYIGNSASTGANHHRA